MPRANRYAVALTALLLASCGPSYPKARVVEALVELCRKEYSMEIQAVLQGATLTVLLPARRLFETPVALTHDADLQALNQQLKFSSEGVDQLQDVALAVRRVLLSTDAPIDFYIVMIRDAEAGQLELRWVGHVLDLKRLSAFDISQGEFLKYRAVIYFRAVPAALARQTVQQLFDDLRERAPVAAIARHFAPQADLQSLLPFLLQQLAPAVRQGGGTGMATLAELKARQIGPETVLVFVRALVPTPGAPPVREQGYYFVVETSEVRGAIRQLIPVAVRSRPHPAFGRWAVPMELTRFGSPERWPDQALFAEEVSLPAFLIEQVIRRVRLDVGSRPGMPSVALAGEYRDETLHFQFRMTPSATSPATPPANQAVVPDPATPHGFATVIAQTAAQTVRSYTFTAFKAVAIEHLDSDTAWSVPAAQLPLYRRRAVPLIPAS